MKKENKEKVDNIIAIMEKLTSVQKNGHFIKPYYQDQITSNYKGYEHLDGFYRAAMKNAEEITNMIMNKAIEEELKQLTEKLDKL